ncbi:MAG: ATP-binding protein [Eubacterium sp.]|nr:ATP-binding protein [Eubacterium sp.]
MLFDKFKNRRPLKLYTRIALFFVIAFSVLLVLSFTTVYFFSQQIIFKENQDSLTRFTSYILNVVNDNKDALMALPEDQRLPYIAEKIEPNTRDNTLISYRLSDSQGGIVRSSQSVDALLNPENLFSSNASLFRPQPSLYHTEAGDFEVDSFRYGGEEYYYLGTSTALTQGYTLYIQVAKNLSDSLAFMNILLGIQIVISVVCLALILLLGIYGTKSSLKPLIEISKTARQITENNLNTRIPETGNKDELDQLIGSLNQMIGQLEQAFDAQKRFVSDASHELRIPLTIIQGYTDILRDWGQDNPELVAEATAAIGEESAGMKELVEELLLLTRLENNYYSKGFERLALGPLLQKTLEECRLIDDTHQYRLSLEADCTIRCNPGLIRQALRAVVDNSAKYTPAGGVITLGCRREKNLAILFVADTGEGIPETALAKVRQRFYRVDNDRSRKTGGTGLGLSITSSIVSLHQGSLEITSQVGVGTTVAMAFPRADD